MMGDCGDGDERPGREGDSHTGGADAGLVLQGTLGTVRRASGGKAVPERSVLTDRMRSFLRGRRLCLASTPDGDRPVLEPCIGDTGFLAVTDETVAWPATALADERRVLVGPDDSSPLALLAVDCSEAASLRVAGTVTRRPSSPAEPANGGSSTDWYVLDVDDAGFEHESAPSTLALGESPEREPAENVRTTYDRLVATAEQAICSHRLAVLSTLSADGAPRITPLTGPSGFVQVLDAHTLAWPVYRDAVPVAGLQASAAATLLFPDSATAGALVQVSGRLSRYQSVAGATDPSPGERADDWLLMDVKRATVSRDPPLPSLSVAQFEPPWGSDG